MIIPKMISLMDWSSFLVMDFPLENIPFLESEDNWRPWGDSLKLIKIFSDIPSTYAYNNWFDWAIDVYYTLIGVEA